MERRGIESMSCSIDLREQVLAYRNAGHTLEDTRDTSKSQYRQSGNGKPTETNGVIGGGHPGESTQED